MRAVTAIKQPFNPSIRGHAVMYRQQETNYCPGCGRTQWMIGRALAECAFCSTAVPLEASMIERSDVRIFSRGKPVSRRSSISRDRPRLVERARA